MTRHRFTLTAAPLVFAAALTAACGGSAPAAPPVTEKIVPTEVGEMSPEEAGGMGAGTLAESAAPHAPHGGTVVKMGTVAALEFVHDPSSGMLTAYVLDAAGTATMRSPVPAIDVQVTPAGGAMVSVSLASTANGLTGDIVGNSSQFGGAAPSLKGVTAFSGVVTSFAAGGETFTNVSFTYPKS
ncbi:MAG TPA: hypothetical protein VMW48_00520 [Vicinamibacterales bacterium]|nr:hypothetical protein [Vicinamibacterales bacterium]